MGIDERYTLYQGDCLDILPTLEANSIDTIITDPPYGLSFMGKDWDHGIPGARFWREALRVAKPGAMLLAFGGTRTHHRLMVAIEDAGWEIRDVIMWVYGSGFPKSHDISKAIDKAAGAEREVVGSKIGLPGYSLTDGKGGLYGGGFGGNGTGKEECKITAPATDAAREWHGYGTALKPAYEPIIVAMKPLDGTFANNALTWGVAGLWVDGGRIPANGDVIRSSHNVTIGGNGIYQGGKACETGAADGRRWPANLIHDGSDEVLAGFPVTTQADKRQRKIQHQPPGTNGIYGTFDGAVDTPAYNDTGSAARFFYCAKASRSERNAGLEGMPLRDSSVGDNRPSGSMSQRLHKDEGRPDTVGRNHHPTVKPLALMRYLARITRTPAGGVVLDPFMGSGSTGMAAVMEGRDFVGIELDADYMEIAQRRITWAEAEAEREGGRQLALFSNGAHQP